MRERMKGKPTCLKRPEPVSTSDLEQYLWTGRLRPKEGKRLPQNQEVSLGWTRLSTQVPGFPGRSFSHKANITGTFFVFHQVLPVLSADWPNTNDLCVMLAVPLGPVQGSVMGPLLYRVCMGPGLHPTLVYNNNNNSYHLLSANCMPSSVLGALLTSYHLVLW